MKKTAEQIADIVLEKVALPRWEQMARKTPGLLEGTSREHRQMRNFLTGKDKLNKMMQDVPRNPENVGLAKQMLENIDPKSSTQLASRSFLTPEVYDDSIRKLYDIDALNAYKNLPHNPDGLTRKALTGKLLRERRPVSKRWENPKSYRVEADLLANVKPALYTAY